jgi:hypothetical protein
MVRFGGTNPNSQASIAAQGLGAKSSAKTLE